MISCELRAILGAIVLAISCGVSAGTEDFDKCKEQFYQGYLPRLISGAQANARAICFDGFAVLYSGISKTPIYVAEYLTPDRLAKARGQERSFPFYEEARLTEVERATVDDYANGSYDRGHMAAAADMPDQNSMAQSFSLANVVPQAPKHNRGTWAKSVESATRKYVTRGHAVYVFTGPIFNNQPRTVGKGRVWVPDELFKLVYDPKRKKAWAFIVPNKDDAKVQGVFTYEQLVDRSKINFLPDGAINQGNNELNEDEVEMEEGDIMKNSTAVRMPAITK